MLGALETEMSSAVNQAFLQVAKQKSAVRVARREELYQETVRSRLA